MIAVHRNFARLRFEYVALYADDIADVVVLFVGHIVALADVVALYIDLNEPVAVGDVRKGRLAHYAAGHQPARNGYLFAFELFKVFLDVSRVGGDVIERLFVRVVALGDEFCKLFAAYARLLGEQFALLFLCCLYGCILVLFHRKSLKMLNVKPLIRQYARTNFKMRAYRTSFILCLLSSVYIRRREKRQAPLHPFYGALKRRRRGIRRKFCCS